MVEVNQETENALDQHTVSTQDHENETHCTQEPSDSSPKRPGNETEAYLDFIEVFVNGGRVPIEGAEPLIQACSDIINLLPHKRQLYRQDSALDAVPYRYQELQGTNVATEGSRTFKHTARLGGYLDTKAEKVLRFTQEVH